MKKLLVVLITVMTFRAYTQELYVYTEPASNMPAHSISAKYIGRFQKNNLDLSNENRQEAELMFGLSKNWMLHASTSFSNMYSGKMRWESVRTYAKYRFISIDEVHRHFRMAAFGEISHSRNPPRYDELSLAGDQSGIGGGLIFTQLLHKLAISSTLGLVQNLQKKNLIEYRLMDLSRNAFNYSLSAGYLLFPRKYKSFDQTNFNIYLEILGSKALDWNKQFVDLAPSFQLIFNSNTKLNFGYRLQLSGNMNRMARESLHISLERTFLNALKRNQ